MTRLPADGTVAVAAVTASAADPPQAHQPRAVRGHAGPWAADVGEDGIPDLVYGDFSEFFTDYRNAGTAGVPKSRHFSSIVTAPPVAGTVTVTPDVSRSPNFAGTLTALGVGAFPPTPASELPTFIGPPT